MTFKQPTPFKRLRRNNLVARLDSVVRIQRQSSEVERPGLHQLANSLNPDWGFDLRFRRADAAEDSQELPEAA